MPEMVASHSSQRFAALLDFQRDVDLTNPSHIGKSLGPGHHRAHQGGGSWQQNWSDSLSSFLSSTFRASNLEAVAPPPLRPCGVEAVVTRSQGLFSPQKIIRNVLKRALFMRDESVVNVKRARTDQFNYVGYESNHAVETMVMCR